MQRVENVRNINMNAKKTEKQKQNKPNETSHKNPQHNPPNNPYNKNGKRPLPPAPAKEEAKPSILDRIIKPGDKAKALAPPSQSNSKPKVVLHTSKHEELTKKFKPNPESAT